MKNRIVPVLATLIGLLPTMVGAATFFSEDFESYVLDGDVTTIGGWNIFNTAATVENEAQWHLIDTKSVAGGYGLPPTVNFGPATNDGGTTPGYDASGVGAGGLYMASSSDGLPPGLLPTLPGGTLPNDPGLPDSDPYDSRIDNGTYTGASNDMITPSFSTVGAAGDVWFHANLSANMNDGGQAVFDMDISLDGGNTWTNQFRRIAPGAGRNFASGDFNNDTDVDGADFLHQQRLMDFSDCLTCGPNPNDIGKNRENTDQRFSDWEKAFQGVYTPLVATVADKNAGGHHGDLDVNLGPIGGNADVKVRFRHFESRDDEVLAIDNIVVNEDAPLGSASQQIFLEDFNTKTLGQMGVYEYTHLFGAFGFDTGHGGSVSGFSWGAQDRPTIDYANESDPDQGPPVFDNSGRYDVGTVDRKNVNHLGHPTPEGASGEVPFAIIDPQAEPEVPGGFGSFQSERMHTPVLDFSNYDTVILEWDDETIFDGNPFAGSVASVVLMVDDDGTAGPSDGDSILNEPDKFTDIFAPYGPFDQFGGGLYQGGDDPIFMHHRIDISADAAGRDDLYLAYQFVSSRTDYWAIDNISITGELLSEAVAAVVPEPSSLLLALFGVPAFATVRRRMRTR